MKDPYGGADIPVFVPAIGDDTLEAVREAFEIGWLGMGAGTRAFEEAIAEYVGCAPREVVATNTGTAALQLAAAIAGVGPGDEVIVASFNFVADHQVISALGATPAFCDIGEDDLSLDPARVAELLGPKTKAIMPLHFAGVPCRLDEIQVLADGAGVRVIEDATHAFGTEVEEGKVGARGDLTCFSFDPVKVITSIDGGAVLTAPGEETERARRYRLLGIDKDTEARYRDQRAWDYDVVSVGYRAHLTNINAAIGMSQLRRIDGFIARRRQVVRAYAAAFDSIEQVTATPMDTTRVSPFIATIRVPAEERTALIEHLRARGIASGIHFLPAHTFSFYEDAPRGPLDVTQRVAAEILTLPLHSEMEDATVDRVIDGVSSYFA